MSTESFWKYFYEIFEALPRQGPGTRESTERALQLLPPLTRDQRILDIGCGSGTQTLDLARATDAQLVGVDTHAPFLEQLERRAAALGLEGRVEAQLADMTALPFPDGSFDVLWAEGSIFIIGFSRGLAAWKRLLRPGGHLVVSEFCWFRENPAPELMEMFLDGNTDAADVSARRKAIADNGYRLVADFVLPNESWWDNYYVPLAGVLERFRAAHAGEPEALAVAARSQRELELYVEHPGVYGYVFFVMQRD